MSTVLVIALKVTCEKCGAVNKKGMDIALNDGDNLHVAGETFRCGQCLSELKVSLPFSIYVGTPETLVAPAVIDSIMEWSDCPECGAANEIAMRLHSDGRLWLWHGECHDCKEPYYVMRGVG